MQAHTFVSVSLGTVFPLKPWLITHALMHTQVPQPPSFYEFTLEVAAIAPSTLPMGSISISEAIAYVRGERSMTR